MAANLRNVPIVIRDLIGKELGGCRTERQVRQVAEGRLGELVEEDGLCITEILRQPEPGREALLRVLLGHGSGPDDEPITYRPPEVSRPRSDPRVVSIPFLKQRDAVDYLGQSRAAGHQQTIVNVGWPYSEVLGDHISPQEMLQRARETIDRGATPGPAANFVSFREGWRCSGTTDAQLAVDDAVHCLRAHGMHAKKIKRTSLQRGMWRFREVPPESFGWQLPKGWVAPKPGGFGPIRDVNGNAVDESALQPYQWGEPEAPTSGKRVRR